MNAHNAIIDALIKSRAIIALPENFTTGTYARAKNGSATSVHSATATCFCLVGSVMRTTGYDHESINSTEFVLYNQTLYRLERQLQATMAGQNRIAKQGIAEYSDTSHHSDVLSLLDNTIASMKAGTLY